MSDQVVDYPYNRQQAKQLLSEAGYPNGFTLDLWYMPLSRPYFPNPKPIAEAFAAELSAIGIKVNLQTEDWAAYLENHNKNPGFQAFMLGWIGDYDKEIVRLPIVHSQPLLAKYKSFQGLDS